jgi:hypothetical protein
MNAAGLFAEMHQRYQAVSLFFIHGRLDAGPVTSRDNRLKWLRPLGKVSDTPH